MGALQWMKSWTWNVLSALRAFRDSFHNGSFLTLLCSVSDFKPDMEDADLSHDITTVTAFNNSPSHSVQSHARVALLFHHSSAKVALRAKKCLSPPRNYIRALHIPKYYPYSHQVSSSTRSSQKNGVVFVDSPDCYTSFCGLHLFAHSVWILWGRRFESRASLVLFVVLFQVKLNAEKYNMLRRIVSEVRYSS